MSILSKEYETNSKNIKTVEETVEAKIYKDFTFRTVGSFYTIEYFSTYGTSSRMKVYKTYRSAFKTWSKIVEEKIDYVNF